MKPNELFEYGDEQSGISYQDLKDTLRSRLEYNYPDIVAKTDPELLDAALGDTASFHEGAEEIGSSDLFIMLRQVIRYIEEETAAKQKRLEREKSLKDSMHDDQPEDESFSRHHGDRISDPRSVDRSKGLEPAKKEKPSYMRQAWEYMKQLGEDDTVEPVEEDFYSDRWAKEKAQANRERMAKEKEQRERAIGLKTFLNPKPAMSAKQTVERLARMGEPMVSDWFHGRGGYDGVRDGIIDMANDHRIKWDTKIINSVLRKWNVKPGDMPEEEMTEDRYTDAWAKRTAQANRERMTGIKDADRARVAAELKAKKEADKLAARTQRDADKAAKKAKLQKDIERLSMMLGSYVGEVFPDSDPYELIANDYREYHRNGTLNKLLDLAARKNGSKNYNDFLADFYEEQAADNPEQWGEFAGAGNPFRESIDEEKKAPWDEPTTYVTPKEIVSMIDQLGFVHDTDNQDLNSEAKMAWKARDFDKVKYKELYKFLKSIGFSNHEGRAYRTRGGQHVNLDDGKGNWIQLGYDRGMSYVSAKHTEVFKEEVFESKGARILAIQKRAETLWKRYTSPRASKYGNRIYEEDLVPLIDMIVGGRTYMFSREVNRVPGAKMMMAAINNGTQVNPVNFMKGLGIMIKHLDKGYGPGLREETQWKAPTWDEARAEAIANLEKSIRRQLDNQGWSGLGTGFGGGTYNRDWKKDLARDKKRLARMKRGEGEDASGRDLYEGTETPQIKSAILAGLKSIVKD